MSILHVTNLAKTYHPKKEGISFKALQDFNLDVDKGEFTAVMGPSGSGKTTLLNLLATIDQPSSGQILIEGTDPFKLKNAKLSIFRRRQLGFVFQDFNLIDTLTVKENILLPLSLEKMPLKDMEARLDQLASLLEITDILNKRTYELSGGQQQRTSCARAIIHQPSIILADEPTGNLDSKSAMQVMNTLSSLNQDKEATILMVTHDPTAASFCNRVIFIKDGRHFSELYRGANQEDFFQRILDTLRLLGGDFHEHQHPRT